MAEVQLIRASERYSIAERERITRALKYAERAHEGQKRFSGEPYIIHPIAVAETLIALKQSAVTVMAGLLHDVLEDTTISADELEREFGYELRTLVEGVTRLGKLRYQGLARHAESLRKFFIAISQDIRVVVIRLADRLHNVETLSFVRPDKQTRIALETIEIYAPLAGRLGMGQMREALEDAAFPYAYPHEYAQVRELLRGKKRETEARLRAMCGKLQSALSAVGVQGHAIDYRVKGLWSLYKKLERYQMDIEHIFDLIALRVVVPDAVTCYQVLGIVHTLWKPVPGRLKDYIALPKPNGYQSIHTSVFVGDGAVAEVQIRDHAMHEHAEYGIASHISYAEMGKPKHEFGWGKEFAWIGELILAQRHAENNEDFLKTLTLDFFRDRIFVFTPKGDVIELPDGATVLDFAFHIHSELGMHCAGARVGGRYVAMGQRLENGDVVEIETKKSSKPTRKWLEHAHTSMAHKHIRQYLKEERATR